MDKFKTLDGKTVSDGDELDLAISHGTDERKISGVVRAFKPNSEHIAQLKAKITELEADNGTRWEIVPSDGSSAMGFLPEHVLTSS